jgi:hypothetical protein
MHAISSLRIGRDRRRTFIALACSILIGLVLGASTIDLTRDDATRQVASSPGEVRAAPSAASADELLAEYERYNPQIGVDPSVSLERLLDEYDRYNPQVESSHAIDVERLLAEYEQYNPVVD